jgi:AcrR family transcriptional regulator
MNIGSSWSAIWRLSDELYERTSLSAMTHPASVPRTDTYRRYLDAAEQAFIRYGYEGASIRRISADADAPLGTLHHYWGNKEALFRDVCARRFAPIQAQQLRRLHAAASGVGQRPDLETVVRALIEPPILAEAADRAQQHAIRLLYGRVLTEPSDIVKRVVSDMFRDATRLFRDLLRAACPDLEPGAFYWRMTCALGAFIFAQSFGDRMGYAMGDATETPDWEPVIDEICAFVVRGMGQSCTRTLIQESRS